VGSSTTAGNAAQHAFITGPNGIGMTDLGTVPGGGSSDAQDINATGQVVGSFYINDGSSSHAFMTGPNGVGMTDLNSLVDLPNGIVLIGAVGINDSGQVIAHTSLQNDGHAYLLSPVPEPEAYVLMLAGLGLLGFLVRCRRRSLVYAQYG
jgi:probable HAF family extracellular repeat protein